LKRRRAKGSRRRGAARPHAATEWVGGSATAPFHVHDRLEPYRPEMVLWLEMPAGHIVGRDVVMPEEAEGAVARTLRHALKQPAPPGTSSLPDAIRVADAATAASVRAEVGAGIPVVVEPTPELDEIFRSLFDSLTASDAEDAEPSYFANGRVSAMAIESLFKAGSALFGLQPWKLSDEPPAIRLDIPALGIVGACVAIAGQLGEARGLLIFPSLEDLDQVPGASAAHTHEDGSLESGCLSLMFESATELPRSMRREAMDHGWRVHRSDAYPVVKRFDASGAATPLDEQDVTIATACALALTAFLARHAAILSASVFEPVCESYLRDRGFEVLLTVPYESYDPNHTDGVAPDDGFGDFDPEPTLEPFQPRTGRNQPCPCGSGRKYKKCHLRTDEARHAERRRPFEAHALDARLVSRLMQFASRKFGDGWRRFEDDFDDARDSIHLAYPWSVYGFKVAGTTVADAYVESRGHHLAEEERRWLEAQRAAWLSIWEVKSVEPGRSLTLHDALSGERRNVLESRASRSLAVHHALLARVVDYAGFSLLAGAHATPLPPLEAAHVMDRARAHLRRKRAAIPPERLRKAAFGRSLIRYWEEAASEVRMRGALPPELRNRDGDPLLLTVDRFKVASGAMERVADAVAELDDAWLDDADENTKTYVVQRDDETLADGRRTVVGSVRLTPTELRIETNSEARAGALRERIEAACGDAIRHRAREREDPLAGGTASGRPRSASPPPSPKEERLNAEYKARHYAEWPDMPLPALNGRTPRECAKTAAGRREVDLLLKHMEHMEHMEHQASWGRPFDFSVVREELGVATPC